MSYLDDVSRWWEYFGIRARRESQSCCLRLVWQLVVLNYTNTESRAGKSHRAVADGAKRFCKGTDFPGKRAVQFGSCWAGGKTNNWSCQVKQNIQHQCQRAEKKAAFILAVVGGMGMCWQHSSCCKDRSMLEPELSPGEPCCWKYSVWTECCSVMSDRCAQTGRPEAKRVQTQQSSGQQD